MRKERVHAVVDEETHDGLVEAAKAESRTLSSLIAWVLRAFVKERKDAGR